MEIKREIENAHKFAYIVQQNPKEKLPELLTRMQVPSIDRNVAIWLATELGFISAPDKETGEVKFLKAPETWQFGTIEDELEQMLLYSFRKIAANESDLHDAYLDDWLAGYAAHDRYIAVNRLLETKQLAEYVIHDKVLGDETASDYTFLTLYENRDKQWGRAQFKKDPGAESVEQNEGPANAEKENDNE